MTNRCFVFSKNKKCPVVALQKMDFSKEWHQFFPFFIGLPAGSLGERNSRARQGSQCFCFSPPSKLLPSLQAPTQPTEGTHTAGAPCKYPKAEGGYGFCTKRLTQEQRRQHLYDGRCDPVIGILPPFPLSRYSSARESIYGAACSTELA